MPPYCHCVPDRAVPSGTLARAGAHPFPIAFGGHTGGLGFNPIISNHYIVYLGLVTTPGSFGGGLATLTPGGGVQIPSPCVLQVSSYLYLVYIYSTDINEGK